jgi:nucleoside-diphosphate-sugar epimerase
MSRRVVIALTGGTGFIGRHLLQILPENGYELRVLLRSSTVLPPECRSAVIGDITRPINLAAALEGVEAVIHSAASSPGMSGAPEMDYRRLNTDATVRLATASEM